jgi:uncharacterized delta-60 repeat protein
MSLIPLGFWAASGGGGVTYWISTLGDSGFDFGYSIITDSAGNSYAFGYTNSAGAGNYDFLLAKYDSLGAIQWQRVLGGASSENGLSVSIDSSDNVYVFGYTTSTGAGQEDFLLAKYNSAGAIQWQRTLGGSGRDYGQAVTVDIYSNVYVIGYSDSSGAGSNDMLLSRYDSSGTIQWQRSLGGVSGDRGYSLDVDSTGNVYVFGQTASTGAGGTDFLLAKYNSLGTIQWQRTLGGASNEFGYSVTIDSSDNVYVLGRTFSTGAGSYDFLLAKYNSSGTIQWQRVLGGASSDTGNSVATDSSDNVYVFGETGSAGAGSEDFLLAKYDSAGTIQWQRTLGGAAGETGYSVIIDSADDVYVIGRTTSAGAGSFDFLLAKLPNDGSLTGTYILNGANIVYSASSLTAATSSLTAATASLTSATSTLTSSTSALTDASASLTSYLVVI